MKVGQFISSEGSKPVFTANLTEIFRPLSAGKLYVYPQTASSLATIMENMCSDIFLVDAVDKFGHDHEFTKLVVDLKGKDPDDAFSTVPYEKVRSHIINSVKTSRLATNST